jgi:ribonucleoside-diphosphate reductase alpha chain
VKEKEFPKDTKITIYSKVGCSYCNVAVMLCKQYNLEYEKKILNQDFTQEQLTEIAESNGNFSKLSYPQIIINNKYVGGFWSLKKYVEPEYDFKALMNNTSVAIRNLDKIIDLNYYPVRETEVSNKRHRPLGLGVQGLADVYARMRYSFDSEDAAKLNKKIFACIYYSAMKTSMELAKEKGKYETFEGSPLSQGKFQFDLWNSQPEVHITNTLTLDWDTLRRNVTEHGVRNSLLLAPMPTASTSQILGNNECIEPFTNNIYVRRTIAGDFIIINKYLMKDLTNLGLWTTEMKDRVIMNNGSVQTINEIPKYIKNMYKTAWDLSQKCLIDQAADRGIYICQSQSLNLFIAAPNIQNLTSMHFYTWSKGLKTGQYYLRTRPAANAQQFTIDPRLYNKYKNNNEECESCSG